MTVGRLKHKTIYLQAEFNAYLQGLNLAGSSIDYYIYYNKLFFIHVNKEVQQVTKADILKHLEYLKNKKGQQNGTRKNNLIGLNHYFTFLHKQEVILQNPCSFLKIRGTKQKSLYRIYTTEELTQLCDNFYQLFVRDYDNNHIPKNQQKQSSLSRQRNHVILSLLIHQGTATKEIDKIELSDLDLMNATLKIHGGKKSNERMLALGATQIGILMHYLQNIRPQFLEYTESEKLFLMLPKYGSQKSDTDTLMHVFKPFAKQVKSIDKHFLSFEQIRASVITHWLRTYGLRKTQYLAGHRYISSTERYLVNDLEDLTNDIEKLHPF